MSRTFGYKDSELVADSPKGDWQRLGGVVLALVFIMVVWLMLDQKLLFGSAWLSDTYDREDWRTNEGGLHTFGAWDYETHVWKTKYILDNFPNFNWNPYWYLGMPLLKYYQLGFYVMHGFFTYITGLDVAYTATLLIIFGHLAATILTFVVCYRVSGRIFASALSAVFLLSNTFMSLRSYGWEPITVVFIFLYPLGLLIFLKNPLKPFRLSMVLLLGVAYLAHPLLWFSLCMTMGVYLVSIAARKDLPPEASNTVYIWQYLGIVFLSMLIGAVQFFPQITYSQVTSGAHMGVTYLPFYQVPFNIISLKDFFFDAGNLKGPGPIIMIATILVIFFAVVGLLRGRKAWDKAKPVHAHDTVYRHELAFGLLMVLLSMVLFYYIELYNIFPMNLLRSIQYHRIIPEFVVVAAVLVAALSNLIRTKFQKVFYYSMLISFVAASGIIIYNVQSQWMTSPDIGTRYEFLYDRIDGRISFPYTDQSLSVRNSFTSVPQVYGYYEQGITNSYDDELFSVSSGFHDAVISSVYLKAANVGRLYVNMQEGERDSIVLSRMNGTLEFVRTDNPRYGYFIVPLNDPSFAQAVDGDAASGVKALMPGCRVMYQEKYCGSVKEEFVSNDPAEMSYLKAYNSLLDAPYAANATMVMNDPDHYMISVTGASVDTAVVVKMTFDNGFSATVNGKSVPIEKIGPDFMLIRPGMSGSYTILLEYGLNAPAKAGLVVSVLTVVGIICYFIFRRRRFGSYSSYFRRGDM